MKRNPQLNLLKKENLAYGGTLLNTRKGRSGARPIATKESMHVVLRSTHATGQWAFNKPKNRKKIEEIVERFAQKYSVKVLSLGNVGNHLHFHVKLGHRLSYKPFIRAITGAIAMAVTGAHRWKPLEIRFWNYRPFTRVIRGFRAFLSLRDYIEINALEGIGMDRDEAKITLEDMRNRPWMYRAPG